MARRMVANLVSTVVALGAAAATFVVSMRYLLVPEGPVDWAVQVCAAATVGVIVFFVAWGHFQGAGE